MTARVHGRASCRFKRFEVSARALPFASELALSDILTVFWLSNGVAASAGKRQNIVRKTRTFISVF